MNQTNHPDKVPLLIHAGFPKTASTWLQTNVFSNNSLGFSSPWGIRCGLAIDQFAVANPYDFNPEDALAAFAQHFPDTKDDVCVISEETLLGDPAKGRYWGKIVADRLYETFPQAKVFICIREQQSYILSAYKEYVRNGGVYSLERYLGVNVDRVGFGGIFQKSFLEYDKVVSYYQKLFGMENVLVLPFEMIESKPKMFIENLLGFTTKKTGNVNFEKVRSSLKSCTIEIRRRLNNYFPQPDWGARKIPFAYSILEKICVLSDKLMPNKFNKQIEAGYRTIINTWVEDHYKQSNQRLSLHVNFDLSTYGYDT